MQNQLPVQKESNLDFKISYIMLYIYKRIHRKEKTFTLNQTANNLFHLCHFSHHSNQI